MHALVEVVTGLAVTPDDVVGDEFAQQGAGLVKEGFVLVGQLNP
jgi:hypothetical protein